MTDRALQQLEELARTDPVAAPLARLQAEALRASADPFWGAAAPPFDQQRIRDGFPALHGKTIRLDPAPVAALLIRLASLSEPTRGDEADRLRHAVEHTALDPLAVLWASLVFDSEHLASQAERADVDLGLLTTLGQLLTVPLLRAAGAGAAPLLAELRPETGYCPVCAAWPVLAELRGLERKRWLRCGRCAASWWCFQQRCSFCQTQDHKLQGYLAPEQDRESRRATTCDGCRAYLKTVTTLGELSAAELAIRDLTSLELDLAAIEQGYGRPETPGFPLEVVVESTAGQPSGTPTR